ncbi:hypothetical protein POV27_09760 [Aureisphaera galaxeae]|uniref:hypothetical protein n=1 Tax=Aureisphaera galaxeae TaxID=1538023 RepID=UPI00235082E6|nr:hypothetical protein [Aureisphaera galaxeae]MDC8004337.1 hypothetical protein [Aureisphaera galaxeae]
MRLFQYLILFLVCHAGIAQTFFDKVEGSSWEGSGTLFGKTAHFTMHWEAALNNTFIKLEFENGFEASEGKMQTMQAHGYYQIAQDGSVSGTWFDSRGVRLPLIGSISSDTLEIFWGDASTEQGKTLYRIENGIIYVEDFYKNKEGKYVNFGNATYEKK